MHILRRLIRVIRPRTTITTIVMTRNVVIIPARIDVIRTRPTHIIRTRLQPIRIRKRHRIVVRVRVPSRGPHQKGRPTRRATTGRGHHQRRPKRANSPPANSRRTGRTREPAVRPLPATPRHGRHPSHAACDQHRCGGHPLPGSGRVVLDLPEPLCDIRLAAVQAAGGNVPVLPLRTSPPARRGGTSCARATGRAAKARVMLGDEYRSQPVGTGRTHGRADAAGDGRTTTRARRRAEHSVCLLGQVLMTTDLIQIIVNGQAPRHATPTRSGPRTNLPRTSHNSHRSPGATRPVHWAARG